MVTSLSLPPNNFFLINFITFTLFFLFLEKKKVNNKRNIKCFFYGWCFGFGYFITNLSWISISLTFDKNFQFLIPISIILIPSFLAIFYGAISYLFFVIKTKNILSSFLLFSLLFGIFEFIRGSILTGFPWNLICYSFSNQLEILSILGIFGTYGFNLFCISLFTSPALIMISRSKKNIIFTSAIFVILLIFYVYGNFVKKEFYEIENKISDYTMRILGTNISLDRYYEDIDPTLVIEDLIKISEPDLDLKTIFVWPEGILPGILQNDLNKFDYLFDEKFNKNHYLILGINNQSKIDKKKFFNSLSLFDHNLNLIDHYNKVKLVPFGEFLPFENFLKTFGLRSITNNYQSFSSGNDRKIIDIVNNNSSTRILPLICYEIIYTGKLSRDTNFDFIINISEDGWFGQSIGPKQHFVHSIFRAIESGKYVLRSSNNGIAAIINPLGIIEQSVKFNNSGYIDFFEYREMKSTIFFKYKNKIFVLLILLYIFLIFSFNKTRNE